MTDRHHRNAHAIFKAIVAFTVYLVIQIVRAPWQLYRQRDIESQNYVTSLVAEHQNDCRTLEETLEQERKLRDQDQQQYEQELHRQRELLGQPDLILDCVLDREQGLKREGDFLLTLRNVGRPLVSNIAACEITVAMGEQIIRAGQEMRREFPVEEAPHKSSPTEWIVAFMPIKDLAQGDSVQLTYRIRNIGPLQRGDLAFVMSNSQCPGPNWKEEFVVVLPLLFEYRSGGSQWQLKYDLCYSLLTKEPWVQSRKSINLDG